MTKSALLAALATTTLALTVAPAIAQETDLSTTSSTWESSDWGGVATSQTDPLMSGTQQMFSSPGSSRLSVNALLSSLSVVGSSDMPLTGTNHLIDPAYPMPTDPSINAVEVVSKAPEGSDPLLERWVIASPAMQRTVDVIVRTPQNPSQPAPMLYLLDGVDTLAHNDWTSEVDMGEVLGGDNVTLVMPTQARASMWTDWQQVDPAFGLYKWETFLTEELPQAIEGEAALNFNGKRGAGGISMGAIGAVQLANLHPGFYEGVFGISGCYSTLDRIGQQTIHATIAPRGGNVENMWGPMGSEGWVARDVTANPAGLDGTKVFLSAGNGMLTADEQDWYAAFNNPTQVLSAASAEAGAQICTRSLEEVLSERGTSDLQTFYPAAGSHNWVNFSAAVRPAWEHIRPALF